MNTDKTLKLIGVACSIIGVGISLIQKQLDNKNLQDLVNREIQKQLNNK